MSVLMLQKLCIVAAHGGMGNGQKRVVGRLEEGSCVALQVEEWCAAWLGVDDFLHWPFDWRVVGHTQNRVRLDLLAVLQAPPPKLAHPGSFLLAGTCFQGGRVVSLLNNPAKCANSGFRPRWTKITSRG
jgi:hypothetical protein